MGVGVAPGWVAVGVGMMAEVPNSCSVPEAVLVGEDASTMPTVKLPRSKMMGFVASELSMSSTPTTLRKALFGDEPLPPPPQPGTSSSAGKVKSVAPTKKRPKV